ncbi:MAG: hypothetical protein R3B47_08960 [Bacteroidia bacterium]
MKSIVIFIAAMLMAHIATAQELAIDTLKGKRVAVIRHIEYGPIGLEIFPTDSTPARRLMIADMDIPLVGAWFLSEPVAKEKEVRMNINDVKRLFFDNPEIEVIGRCSAEEVMEDSTIFPDSVMFKKVQIRPEFQFRETNNFLLVGYTFQGPKNWGGVRVNLLIELDKSGNELRRFVLTGSSSEQVQISQNGKMVYFASYFLGERISWSPCLNGDIFLWDLESNTQLFVITGILTPIASLPNKDSRLI